MIFGVKTLLAEFFNILDFVKSCRKDQNKSRKRSNKSFTCGLSMPKRKKRGSKLKNTTETTTSAETASSSTDISSGSNCDDSAMNVKIEMPKVYGRSNSLFGTFGLLDAQKPAVVKIKKEPAEVNKPKTSDTFNITIENVCEVKLSECSVVLTDLAENLVEQEVIGEKQRVINATEKEPVIVDDFCVEKCNENMLEQLIENKEGDSNFDVEASIGFPIIGEKQRVTDNTEKELVIVSDFCVEKGNENVSEQLIENKENHSNSNVETATDFPIIGEKRKITDNNEKELLIIGAFCVEEDNENMLEPLTEKKESNCNFNVQTTIDFPATKYEDFNGEKHEVTNTDMNIEVNDDIFVKKESDVIETENELMEQEESDTDRKCSAEHSAKEYHDNYLNGTGQNESSIKEDIFDSLTKFSAGKNIDYFFKNVKKEIQLEESDADDDIVFLKEVCKKCLITETREGFCCHFPSLVE